jgi:predicted Zn finger-like uncharacterized protein
MKLTCHSCGAKYTVSDEKIQGKTVKMKCRKCGSTIVVGGAQADAGAQGGADDAGSPPAGSFLVNVADGDQRTMSLAEIVEAHRAGVVTDDTYVWADGMTDWQAVVEHPEIAAAVHGGAPAQPSMHSVPSFEPAAAPSSPGDEAPPYAAAAAEAPRAVAAKKEGNKASRDLFGQDRPSTGGGGGLFGASGGGGSMMSSSTSSGTGKRDENSVLFSLSALTSVETAAPAGKTTAKKDDSGLIDLKALAASAPSTPATSATEGLGLLPDTAAVFPLGLPVAPPPQAAPAVAVEATPPPKSKLPLVIGGVGAVAAMIAVFFLVKGDPPPPPAPTPTPVTAAAPAPTPEPAPTPVAEPTAEPSATASASASAPVAARPTGKWPPAKPGGATAKPPSGGGAATPTPPKPPPPKSKCGCAPSDLMCNMRCSAGKK